MNAAQRPSWLDAVQKAPAHVPKTATRPSPLLFNDQHQPIRSALEWEARDAELKRRWSQFLGLGKIEQPRGATALKVLEEDRDDGVIRQLVQYEAEAGLPVEGYLLRPIGPLATRSRPGVVVLHSTVDHTIRQPAGLDGPTDKHVGLHLAKRGYVAFCSRCFLWQHAEQGKISGAVDWLKQRHPGITGMAKMLFDATRAVDALASQPDVDPERLGSFGHSLGAKEVLYLSAFDPRIRATVSSEGGIGISYSNWEAPWYLGEAVQRPGFPLDHGQILAMSAPRAFLLIGGDSADGDQSWPYVEAALPVWSLLGAPEAIGLFNHKQGHSLPELARNRSYEWLDWFLRARG